MVTRTIAGVAAWKTDRRGVTSIEYALISLFILLVIVGSVAGIGRQLAVIFMAASAGL